MITEQSFVEYTKNNINISFGRRYIDFGTGYLSGLFISPVSPSLDNISISLKDFKNIDYTSFVVRLDNRETIWEGEKEVAYRWLLLRKVGLKYKNFRGGLIDAVVSTGFNRSVDWYYLTPLSFFFMERKHQHHWREGGDSTTVTGLGDNDNHFVGGYWRLSHKDMSFYGEWLIDEWQLTPEHRPHVQTIFGLMFGMDFHVNSHQLVFEYALASPWLYLSRGLFNTSEYHGLPLGLERPDMHSIGFVYRYLFDENRSIKLNAIFKQSGPQTFSTQFDPWDNKKKLFNYKRSYNPELSIKYLDKRNKYFDSIELKSNWLGNQGIHLILGWDFQYEY